MMQELTLRNSSRTHSLGHRRHDHCLPQGAPLRNPVKSWQLAVYTHAEQLGKSRGKHRDANI
jgi:hypothetical protein